jgi:hypothetical protein
LLNETYDAIGGLQGAVASKADELLSNLSPEDQKILQRVFLRIVRPSESGLDTRRRAAFTELPPEGARLVARLANARLLVTNQSDMEQTVEVAHEALISNWSTLRAWVNEDREFLLWRERLGTLLAEWERAEENADALLRGPLLTEAQKWFDQRTQDLCEEEQKFITISRQERDRRAREAIERHEHDIEAARKLAEALRDRAEEAEKRVLEEKRRAEISEKRENEQKEAARKLRQLALAAAGAATAAVLLLATSGFMWRKSQLAADETAKQAKEAAKQAQIAIDQRSKAEEQTRIAVNEQRLAVAAEDSANHARDQADGLINFMLYDLRDKLEPTGRLDVLDDVAKKAKEFLDAQPKEPVPASRLEQQAGMLNNLGDVLVAQGKLQEAFDAYQQSLNIRKRLVDADKLDPPRQRDLSVSYEKVGDVLLAGVSVIDALA